MPIVNAGAGNLRVASVTLTDAQIKALPVTPIQIVAPTETNNYVGNTKTVPFPVFAFFALNFNAGGYTNVAAGGSKLGIFLDQFGDVELTSLDSGNAFTQSGNQQMIVSAAQTVAAPNVTAKFTVISDGGIHDNGLYVAAANGGAGAFTAGNAANTLGVSVGYVVLATGLP